jgi:glycosidase
VGGNQAQYRLAAATYLLQPGTPFIYYGEEIGMAGVKSLGGDPSLRTPMSWTADATTAGFTTGKPFRPVSPNIAAHNAAAQRADPNSLLNFYSAMLKLRNTLPSIAQGSYQAPFVSGSVMGYQRKLGNENTLVLINYGTDAASVAVNGLASNATLVAAYPKSGETRSASAGGTADVRVDAQSVMVFTLER